MNEPGTIHPDIGTDHRPDVSTKHLMFVRVFTRSGLPNPQVVLGSWLQAVTVATEARSRSAA